MLPHKKEREYDSYGQAFWYNIRSLYSFKKYDLYKNIFHSIYRIFLEIMAFSPFFLGVILYGI